MRWSGAGVGVAVGVGVDDGVGDGDNVEVGVEVGLGVRVGITGAGFWAISTVSVGRATPSAIRSPRVLTAMLGVYTSGKYEYRSVPSFGFHTCTRELTRLVR
jgi:hypothetical protein